MIVYLNVFLVSLVFLLLYTTINLYKKVLRYERWEETFQKKIINLKQTISEIDNKNIFEKDDEVGVVYEEISEMIKNIEMGLE